MEAIPYLSALSAFITIARAVRDILKRNKKEDEAEAVENAVTAIEKDPTLEVEEAKHAFQESLKQQLGDERAKPVIEYTELVDTFFPFKPRGRVLHYGMAIEQLLLEVHRVLYDLDAFKLYGNVDDVKQYQNLPRWLDFPLVARSLHGQGILDGLLHGDEYSLNVSLFEIPPHDLIGGPKARSRFAMDDYLLLKVKKKTAKAFESFWVFVSADEGSPFSLTFRSDKEVAERRLAFYEFGHIMNALIADANAVLERVTQEYEQSKDEIARFASAMKALDSITKHV